MKNAPGIDGRTRVHLWPESGGASWSVGPCGVRRSAPTYGDALNDALATTNLIGGAAVVILEPREEWR